MGSTSNQLQSAVTTPPAKAVIAGTGDAGLDGLSVQYVVLLDPNNPANKITPGQMTGGFMPTNPRLLTTADMVSIGPSVSGGATTYEFNNTGTFTVQTIKGTAGTLYALEVTNLSGATTYVTVYDATGPTPGSGAKIVLTVATATTVWLPMGTPGRVFNTAITIFAGITSPITNTGSAAGVYISAAYL